MLTVLTDIEASINSRPLTYTGDDIRDGRFITPALLAIGRDLESPPDNLPKKAEVSLSERYRYQQRLQNNFGLVGYKSIYQELLSARNGLKMKTHRKKKMSF